MALVFPTCLVANGAHGGGSEVLSAFGERRCEPVGIVMAERRDHDLLDPSDQPMRAGKRLASECRQFGPQDPGVGRIGVAENRTAACDLLSALSTATERGMKQRPGFVSANLHVSRDGKHVTNYAQWRSQADLDAMMADPDAQAHMREAGGIAEPFDPIYHELRETHSAHVAGDGPGRRREPGACRRAVEDGFCLLAHGKEAPLRRMTPGDHILYNAPHKEMGAGEVVRAFVALGTILAEKPAAALIQAGAGRHWPAPMVWLQSFEERQESIVMSRPPLPPFTPETAAQKGPHGRGCVEQPRSETGGARLHAR